MPRQENGSGAPAQSQSSFSSPSQRPASLLRCGPLNSSSTCLTEEVRPSRSPRWSVDQRSAACRPKSGYGEKMSRRQSPGPVRRRERGLLRRCRSIPRSPWCRAYGRGRIDAAALMQSRSVLVHIKKRHSRRFRWRWPLMASETILPDAESRHTKPSISAPRLPKQFLRLVESIRASP